MITSPRLLWAVVLVALVAGGSGAWWAMRSDPPSDAATGTPSPTWPAVAWLDKSDGVLVLRNPSTMSDAAQHVGSFSIGEGDCLYVTVVDDNGSNTYPAGPGPTTVVTRERVSTGDVTYVIGTEATFGGTEIVGQVPDGAFAACTGATTAYGLELAPPHG